jgi:acetyltransferase-like isoleucine patch superfamily enzyme
MFKNLLRLFKRRRKSRRAPLRDRFAVGRATYGEPTVLQWGQQATLRVGAFCSIAREVTIFLGGEHRTDWVTTYPFMRLRKNAESIEAYPTTRGDVVIGNDVWIGYGATIMSGVRIGDGAVIGARALVTRDVPEYAIVGGNPAKLLRMRFPEETVRVLTQLAWWDWADADLDRAVPWLMSGDVEGLARFAATELGHDVSTAPR